MATDVHDGAIGVVISIPGTLSQQLTQWRAEFGEDPAGLLPPHITILTLGSFEASRDNDAGTEPTTVTTAAPKPDSITADAPSSDKGGGTPDASAGLDVVRQIAAAHAPFRIELRGSATFEPRSPVVYIPLTAGSAECRRLHHALLDAGWQTRAEFPYHPHVTLAQGVPPLSLDEARIRFAGFAAHFEATALEVYQWRDGSWTAIDTVPFTG